MTEDFLHHIWKYKLFNQTALFTDASEAIDVLKTGEHNTDAGPDFFNARIKIDDKVWVGNVEIHVNSSDWIKHNHQRDEAYNSVILHVVYQNDKPIFRKDGSAIPVLSLKDKFDADIWQRYLQLQNSQQWVPCAQQIKEVDEFVLFTWKERLLIERLELKADAILAALKLNNNNWEETFYQQLARNFGFKVNAVPFELLAKSLPNTYLAKHKDKLFLLEAMLFGQAGMLNDDFKDDYALQLQKEYRFFAQKFSLQPIEKHLWKFFRLRPYNFPTIRIAQFAALTFKSTHLFSKVIETTDVEQLKELFNVEASVYWESHYVFDKEAKHSSKSLGKAAIDIVLINTIAPILFVYGMQKNEDSYKYKAIELLEQIDAENNTIIQNWVDIGIQSGSAADSQAMIQLKNAYCSAKKCLSCAIGNKLIGKNVSLNT